MAQQARLSSQPPLPPEAYQYAGTYQLGNPVAVYKASLRSSIILGILCLPFTALFLIVAFSGDSSSITIMFMLLLSFLCAVGAVYYLVFSPVHYGSWRIYLCTNGFLFLKGSGALPYRWDQVAFVWQKITRNYTNGIYTGTTFKYTVRRVDGAEVAITQMFRNGSQLGTQIQQEVTRRLTPVAWAALNAGQPLPFGQFNVSRQGLATSKGLIPWNQIQQVTAKSGLVVIQRRGERSGKYYGGVEKVPNLHVFFNVANEMAAGQR